MVGQEKIRVLIMDFSEFLSLCKEADDLVRELVAKSPKASWQTLKAAAIHYLARKKGLDVTLNNLYLIYGTHQAPIMDAKKIIRDLDSDNKKGG